MSGTLRRLNKRAPSPLGLGALAVCGGNTVTPLSYYVFIGSTVLPRKEQQVDTITCEGCASDLTYTDNWSRWDDNKYWCFGCLPPDDETFLSFIEE